jgi:hypothetical protein
MLRAGRDGSAGLGAGTAAVAWRPFSEVQSRRARIHTATFLCKANVMLIPFIVLVLAALSRLLPHAMHGVGYNITAVGAGLLFFGSRRPRYEAVIGAAVMALTDVYLTEMVYGLPFHISNYIVTWLWYAAVCLIGSGLLRRVTVLQVAASVFASATGFFVVSDLVVWAGGQLYPRTLAGLESCFAAALPFYANDLISTAIVSAVLFGLPVLAKRMVDAFQTAAGRKHPLA